MLEELHSLIKKTNEEKWELVREDWIVVESHECDEDSIGSEYFWVDLGRNYDFKAIIGKYLGEDSEVVIKARQGMIQIELKNDTNSKDISPENRNEHNSLNFPPDSRNAIIWEA